MRCSTSTGATRAVAAVTTIPGLATPSACTPARPVVASYEPSQHAALAAAARSRRSASARWNTSRRALVHSSSRARQRARGGRPSVDHLISPLGFSSLQLHLSVSGSLSLGGLLPKQVSTSD